MCGLIEMMKVYIVGHFLINADVDVSAAHVRQQVQSDLPVLWLMILSN